MFSKVVAELGTDAMTTHQICMNIINLSFACGDGLGAAAAAMVGQNLGRGRSDISLMYGRSRSGLHGDFHRFYLFSSAFLAVYWFPFLRTMRKSFNAAPKFYT